MGNPRQPAANGPVHALFPLRRQTAEARASCQWIWRFPIVVSQLSSDIGCPVLEGKRGIMFLRVLAAVVVALCLSACVSPAGYQKLGVDEIARQVEIQDSEFDRQKTVVGPAIFEPVGLFASQRYRLRGWIRKDGGEERHQLYVTITYDLSGWAFFERASFLVGEPRPLDLIGRDVGSCTRYGCTHVETVGVSFDRAYLEAHRGDGLRIRLDAKSGATTVITVPPNYVAAYLSVVDALKAGL